MLTLTLLVFFIFILLIFKCNSIVILNLKDYGKSIKIKEPKTIGKKTFKDKFDFISTNHCEFIRGKDNNWKIKDLKSINGTRLNNELLDSEKEYPIKNGDNLELGKKLTLTVNIIESIPENILYAAISLYNIFLILGFLLAFSSVKQTIDKVNISFKNFTVSYDYFTKFDSFALMVLIFVICSNLFLIIGIKIREKNISGILIILTLITIGLQNIYCLLPQISYYFGIKYLQLKSISNQTEQIFSSYIFRHTIYFRYWLIVCLGLFILSIIMYLAYINREKIFVILSEKIWFKIIAYIFAGVAILITILTIFFGSTGGREIFVGESISMPRLFLNLGFTTIQSIDIVKLCLLFFLSFYFSASYLLLQTIGKITKYWMPLLIWALGIIFIVAFQRDFGGSLILLCVLIAYAYVFLIRFSNLLIISIIFVLFVTIIYFWHPGPTSIIKSRIDAWLFPFHYGEQVAQAIWAISSGGFSGKGMNDFISYIIPDIHNDLVFASIAEWGGWWLSTIVLILYLMFHVFLARQAKEAKHSLWRFFLIGISILFGTQAILIICGTVGMLPLSGITLPFISHGGSSLIISILLASMALLGPVMGNKPAFCDLKEIIDKTENNLNRFSIIIGIVTCALCLWLCFLMLIFPGVYQEKRIYDTKTINAIKNLIKWEVLKPLPSTQKVIIDKEKLNSIPKENLPFDEEKLRKYLRYLSVENGEIIIQEIYFSRPSSFKFSKRPRGDILDQFELPLATTNIYKKRYYPLRAATFHPVGYLHPAYGSSGLEKAYYDTLIGKSLSFWQKIVAFKHNIHKGINLKTTIISSLQSYLYNNLKNKQGAAIVMEIKSGEILALVSTPAIDPNNLGELFDYASESRGEPFFNRAVEGLYFPGSLFKLIVASAAIENKDIDVNQTFLCQGKNKYKIGCHIDHGNVSLYNAFAYSCNSYFSQLAVLLGDSLLETTKRVGFNTKDILPPIDGKSMVPKPSLAFTEGLDSPIIDFYLNPKLVAQCGIGQNLVQTNIIHLAALFGAAANGGKISSPTIVKEIIMVRDKKEKYSKNIQDKKTLNFFSKETARQLLYLMEGVFEEKGGTAYSLPRIYKLSNGSYGVFKKENKPKNANAINLAGKTGTAEVEGKQPHSWMVVLAPAEKPKIVSIVLIEHGGWGASTSGPIAINATSFALNLLNEKEKKNEAFNRR